jgi:hypothetical protein
MVFMFILKNKTYGNKTQGLLSSTQRCHRKRVPQRTSLRTQGDLKGRWLEWCVYADVTVGPGAIDQPTW